MLANPFGLRRQPFRTTPDTEAYYPATTHEIALRDLERGLDDGEPISLLRADTGMGKTLLLRRLLEQRGDESCRPILITQPIFAGPRDLLQAILFECGCAYQGLSETEARLAATAECLNHYGTGGRTIIAIDEAHHLNRECLEELRLLGNLAGNNGPAVQVVLAALPTVWNKIDADGMESLLQRLAVRPELRAFDENESMDYLVHQLRWAGAKKPDKLFDMDTLNLFARHARGIPRLLNQLAGTALQLAGENGLDAVDYEAASEAIALAGLGGEAEREEEEELVEEDAPTIRLHPEAIKRSQPFHLVDVSNDEDVTVPYAQAAGELRANGKRVVFPPIVITDTYPPKFIYDGDAWVQEPFEKTGS